MSGLHERMRFFIGASLVPRFSKQFFFFNRKEKFQVVGLGLMMFVGAGLEAGGIGLVAPLTMLLRDPSIIQTNKICRGIYNAFAMGSTREFALWFAIGVLAFYFFKSVYLIFLFHIQHKFICAKVISMQVRLFRAYLNAPYVFHLAHNSADLQNRAVDQVRQVVQGVFLTFLTVLSESAVVSVVLTMLFLVDPLSTLVVMTMVGGMSFLFFYVIRNKFERLGRATFESSGQVIKWANQGFGSIKESKILKCEPFFTDAFARNVSVVSKSQASLFFWSQMPRFWVEMFVVVGLFLVLAAMSMRGKPMEDSLPTLALLAASTVRLFPSANRILNALGQMRIYKAPTDVIYSDLVTLEKHVPTVFSDLSMNRLKPKIAFSRSIELRNISYCYPSAVKPVIRDISLIIPRGSSIAFVGPSGAGKTTLVDIILGLLEPTGGEILVDGVNIRHNFGQWQSCLGYIPQMIYLCDDTIRRNVALGLSEEEIDDEKVWAALRAAHLHDFVKKLAGGLDTPIGERGIRLSGGERQRIGIARALYHDPDVLVLDEATSSLDYVTEKEVNLAIERLSGIKTLIVIAHRFSTVRNCKNIHSIKDGELVGQVSYDELVTRSNS